MLVYPNCSLSLSILTSERLSTYNDLYRNSVRQFSFFTLRLYWVQALNDSHFYRVNFPLCFVFDHRASYFSPFNQPKEHRKHKRYEIWPSYYIVAQVYFLLLTCRAHQKFQDLLSPRNSNFRCCLLFYSASDAWVQITALTDLFVAQGGLHCGLAVHNIPGFLLLAGRPFLWKEKARVMRKRERVFLEKATRELTGFSLSTIKIK